MYRVEHIENCDPREPSQTLSTEAMCRILGTKFPVPLTSTEMAKSLRVAFYPEVSCSPRLEEFLQKLRSGLVDCGASILSYEEALAEGSDGRIGEGIILIAPGEGEPGNLAIDHVASLSNNTVVAVLDGTLPGIWESALQRRLNSLISAMVWHMAHVVIYVDETSWTVGNMNGAIDTFSLETLHDRILLSLVPKLAAPVVPPQKGAFDVREEGFEATGPDFRVHVEDLVAGSKLWGKSGLLMSQTRMEELAFRNNKYRRIASAFLSWRTGMSYGFLARQLPLPVRPAIDLDEAPRLLRLLDWTEKDFYEIDNHLCVVLRLKDRRFLIRIPNVSVLCTRSGCEKTRLEPAMDLLELALIQGRVAIRTPKGTKDSADCQPSFDTTTILAHGVGNAIVASILGKVGLSSKFYRALTRHGVALAHWHGFVHPSQLHAGYYLHGQNNPPVSCSTPQAAIYALLGKLASLQRSLEEGIEYLGDVHVEPSHGTNITGTSLVELSQLVKAAAL